MIKNKPVGVWDKKDDGRMYTQSYMFISTENINIRSHTRVVMYRKPPIVMYPRVPKIPLDCSDW